MDAVEGSEQNFLNLALMKTSAWAFIRGISLFVCVDALHPSQQFFSHVGMISCLPDSVFLKDTTQCLCESRSQVYQSIPLSHCPAFVQMLCALKSGALAQSLRLVAINVWHFKGLKSFNVFRRSLHKAHID